MATSEVAVHYRCHSCASTNKQLLGAEGFVARETEFDAISDVWNHLHEYNDHWMTAFVVTTEVAEGLVRELKR